MNDSLLMLIECENNQIEKQIQQFGDTAFLRLINDFNEKDKNGLTMSWNHTLNVTSMRIILPFISV